MQPLILYLNSLPPEAVWILQLLFCYCSALIMLRLFGASGLYVFIGVVVIAANIDVLKVVQFSLFSEPVPLGTVLFTSTFLAVDILTQYYGPEYGKRGIQFGFAAMILMSINMTIALGFHPIGAHQAIQARLPEAYPMQTHMFALFSPALGLLIASLTSFFISQYTDIFIFQWVRRLTGERYLWLRNNVSTIVSSLIDNTIFNVTWTTIAHYDITWHTLIFSYVLGTYAIRVVISILDTPFIYLAKYLVPKKTELAL